MKPSSPKKLKALLIGDPHFKVNNEIETNLLLTETIRVIRQYEPNIVVVMGDILDTHEKIHVKPLMRALKYLEIIRDLVPELYILIGNHDRENNNDFLTDTHPFSALKEWDKTYVVDKVIHRKFLKNDHGEFASINPETYIHDKEYPQHPIDLIFVPYVPPGRFVEALETIDFDYTSAHCIFAHQEFAGAKMNTITSNEGDEWPYVNPLVYSGHIHEYQVLQPNLIYVGTPLQHGFSDDVNKKFILANFSHDNLEPDYERIDIKLFVKRKIELTLEELYSFEPNQGEILKIVIKGDRKSIREALKNKDIEKKVSGAKVVIKDVVKIKKTDDIPIIKTRLKFKEGLENIIKNSRTEVRQEYESLFGSLPQSNTF